jgi:hypothetical protein
VIAQCLGLQRIGRCVGNWTALRRGQCERRAKAMSVAAKAKEVAEQSRDFVN